MYSSLQNLATDNRVGGPVGDYQRVEPTLGCPCICWSGFSIKAPWQGASVPSHRRERKASELTLSYCRKGKKAQDCLAWADVFFLLIY